ncbi:hypothetical protein E4U17_005322 [Claviceps sp. LM77 group G4]|nr:hypothetical protein E4U17_005322 [Claviceps sp. LM77 group G4]KAG6071577.1 hypothetical protein E4U33_003627 [Claviceps sp. LM78 group G4]KAG6075974.1 hypothetical protein E4U16_003043 [Claviceps sp. LM84 group G4]
MSIPPAYHESLPYIDPAPSAQYLETAKSLIQQALSSTQPPPPPPPSPPSPKFSPAITTELSRIASSTPLPPLDTTRYEAQDLPSNAQSSTEQLRSVLSKAYTSHAYLESRIENLTLLEKHGANAWLLSNYHLESELRRLEGELVDTKRQIDEVNALRARRQEDVKGELESLESTWRKGVGRVLETEIAVEALRAEVREELRRQSEQV